MNYKDLLEKFENTTRIPYEDLLRTSEWKQRRTKIIQRDEDCCSSCHRMASVYVVNHNISPQNGDKIIAGSVAYNNKTFATFKEEMAIEKINVFHYPFVENIIYAVSPKGQLFLVDLGSWEEVIAVNKNDLVVNIAKSERGRDVWIISLSGRQLSDVALKIPTLVENTVVMHVHHKFYIMEKLPWEYEDDALLTLCNWCHWELHEKTVIPVYTVQNGELNQLDYHPCFRCHGAGVLPEYSHVESGVCFRCRGTRYEELAPKSA